MSLVRVNATYGPCGDSRDLALSRKVGVLFRVFTASLALVGLSACGAAGEYRNTGRVYAPRGPDCDYRVLRHNVAEPYEEIGVVDVGAFSLRQLPTNEERFREAVGEHVCKSGGHAVIPSINVQGRWVHGTVIRFRPGECERCRDGSVAAEACEEEG